MPLYSLTRSQLEHVKKFFKENSTGELMVKRNLEAILEKHGLKATDTQLQNMIDAISLNEKGISLEGFANYVADFHGMREKDKEYAEAFRAFDVDGDGTISKEEIKYVTMLMGMDIDWKSLIKEADKDGDGKIDYDEFVELMKKF